GDRPPPRAVGGAGDHRPLDVEGGRGGGRHRILTAGAVRRRRDQRLPLRDDRGRGGGAARPRLGRGRPGSVRRGRTRPPHRVLRGLAAGELTGAIAMTEPGVGSDLQSVATRAVKDGDDWVISGAKTFITNGQNCDFVIVVARTNPEGSGAHGTSLFIVDDGTP